MEEYMEIVTKEKRNTLSARLFTPVTELPQRLGEIYGEIGALFATGKAECLGAPFVIYYNMDMDKLDIEAGFPVKTDIVSEGRFKASTLPGGEQAVMLYTGSYDGMGEAYEKLTAFVNEKGRETESFVYEEYLNSPDETAPEELQTNICFILK